MSRELVTLHQAVDRRPWLTERWLRRLVAERRIPYHKVGGRLLFDLADLDALAEHGRVECRPSLRTVQPAGPRATAVASPRQRSSR